MSFFEFPHTRTYDSDLGWIIRKLIETDTRLKNFINLNTIKYANPIAWNITTQYEANTVVIDPATGTAYISTQAVPSGVSISNTGYWTPIFNYGESMDTLRRQIAYADEGSNWYASAPRSYGQLVWIDGLLYVVTADIAQGTQYVPGVNVARTTIEDAIQRLDTYLTGLINDQTQQFNDRIDAVENGAGQYYKSHFAMIGDSNAVGAGWPGSWGVFTVLHEIFPEATFDQPLSAVTWNNVTDSTLNMYAKALTLDVNNPPDVIFTWCGGNDITAYSGGAVHIGFPDFDDFTFEDFDGTTVYGGMNKTLAYLRKYFPHTKIVGVIRTYKEGSGLEKQKAIYGMINAIYKKYGCAVINLNDYANICEKISEQKTIYFAGDGIHYNERAYRELIAPVFLGAITAGLDVSTEIDVETIYTDLQAGSTNFDLTTIPRYFGQYLKTSGALRFRNYSDSYQMLTLFQTAGQNRHDNFLALRLRSGAQNVNYIRYDAAAGANMTSDLVQSFDTAPANPQDVKTAPDGIYVITGAQAPQWTGLDTVAPCMLIIRSATTGFRYYMAIRYDGTFITGIQQAADASPTWTYHS